MRKGMGVLLLCAANAVGGAESTMASAPAIPAPGSATPAPTPAVAGEEEVLDEVLVQGTKLWQLREAIVLAEERFYALYNELSNGDEFDVTCRKEAPLGTRLKKRVCQIGFMEEAEAEYAQAWVTGSFAAPEPGQVWVQRSGDYRENALRLLNGHPELLKLAKAREQAEKKYNAERKKRFKGRWILFE
jgi:hypothetical protein